MARTWEVVGRDLSSTRRKGRMRGGAGMSGDGGSSC